MAAAALKVVAAMATTVLVRMVVEGRREGILGVLVPPSAADAAATYRYHYDPHTVTG